MTPVNSKVSVGTSTLFIIILAFMLASPRGSATKTAIEAEIAGYDDTVTNRALMMASMVLHVSPNKQAIMTMPTTMSDGLRVSSKRRHANRRHGAERLGSDLPCRERASEGVHSYSWLP